MTGPGWLRVWFLALLATSVLAQTSLPTPPGGSVRALAADPFDSGRVLLGTNTGGVFVSSDSGFHWSFLSQVAPHDDWVVASLVPDATRAGRWFAGLWSWNIPNGGVFVSDNGGKTWRPLLRGHAVRALAQAPSAPTTLVAATLDGVYRTQDEGQAWTLISPTHDRELANIESVAIDPIHAGEIYVGTWHLPWKTVNGGHDWWQMRQGVIDDSDVFSIAVDQSRPATVYLSACSGIYRSDNRGSLFRKIQGIPYSARRTPALVQAPADPNTIYAGTTQGLWVTHDGGATWTRITSATTSINSVLLLPQPDSPQPRILLGTNFGGILASSDGGRTFQTENLGFSSRHVSAAASSPHGLYVAVTGDQAWGGIQLHTSDGSWRSIPPPLPGQDVLGLHWSPAGLLAATAQGVYLLPSDPPPLHARRPAQNWIRVHTAPRGPVYSLAGLAAHSLDAFVANPQGLFATRDGGRSWTWMKAAPAPLYALFATPAASLSPDSSSPGWLFVAGNGYLLRSNDLGLHFLPGRLALEGRVNQVAVLPAPSGPGMLFAATTRGLYRSADLGNTWTLCGHGLPALNIQTLHVQDHRIYAAAAQLNYTYVSDDAGATWRQVELAPQQQAIARTAPALLTRWITTDSTATVRASSQR